MELTVPADDKQLETVLDFIHKQLPADCETDLMYKIDVAAEEIFSNFDELLTIIFRDQGVPFNPLDRPDPDITLSAEDRSIGGLGIFLTKKYMDSIEYRYEGDENILTMKKMILRNH